MTVFADSLFSTPITQDDLEPTAGERVRATVADTFSSLVGPSLLRMGELDEARKWGGGAYGEITPEQARAAVDERGLGEHLKIEDRNYNPLELGILVKRKEAELRRQYVLQRAGGGFARGSERLLLSLGTSLLDPLTIATAFVPVVGEARYAGMLERAGASFAKRAAVRGTVGALEGSVGQALVEPIVYSAKQQEQADYTLYDSLANIAFGGVFGGGLHAVGGAVGDFRAGRRTRLIERATETLQNRLQELEQAGAIPPRADTSVPDPYFDRAKALLSEIRSARTVDTNDPASVEKLLGYRPKSLSQFIRETGGINDNGGELSARDVTSKRAPGLIRKDNMGAASVDAVRERVFEEGYFPGKRDYNEISDSELFDAIAEDLFVEKRWTSGVEDQLMPARQAGQFVDEMASYGFRADMSPSEIATALRDLDEVMRPTEAPNSGADDFAEYERMMASRRASEASPQTRQAALHGAVAQDLMGEPINVEPAFELDATTRTKPIDETLRELQTPRRPVQETPPEVVEAADAPVIEEQIADLEQSLKDLEAELKAAGEELPAELRAEIDEANALASESEAFSEAARMLAACAMRSIA